MAQECGFFNAHLVGEEYDRVYLAEQFAAYFASFIGNGIFGKSMQKLEVLAQSTPNMSVKVLSGEAWINGWWYRNTEEYTLSIDVADGVLSRIDAIVLRWGNEERDMWLQVIKGTASSNPVAPTIRRDADYYDLQLAAISIIKGTVRITQSAISDTRLNNAVCGLVTGVVDQIDTTDLYNQFEAYFSEFKNHYEADFNQWTAEQQQAYLDYISNKQTAYDTWTANKMSEYDQFVNLKEQDYNSWTDAQKERYLEWYDVHTEAWTAEFNAWFADIQDILSGDVAGNLLNEINSLKVRVTRLEEFEYNLTEKQEVYPTIYDTQYSKVLGELTNEDNVVIADENNDPIELIGDESEPVLDNNSDRIRSVIKFCIL